MMRRPVPGILAIRREGAVVPLKPGGFAPFTDRYGGIQEARHASGQGDARESRIILS